MKDMFEQTAEEQVKAYSVTEVSLLIKGAVENIFQSVSIKGEISNLKIASSGHVYFDLKDDRSVINCICWRGVSSKQSFKLEDGLEIITTGKITTYPGRSTYQIIVDSMSVAGQGALLQLLEKRKKMFAEEGLFDSDKKKAIPFFPKVIGVISSPTGAVIRDIIHRISDRYPLHILLLPTAVQGTDAAPQIAKAIQTLNNITDKKLKPDTIIVARGGGSIEDLWPFNEEIVVRAAYASAIPIISAVGHETDFTLIDYVADKRAPTPTAAAEMATPVKADLLTTMETQAKRLNASIPAFINTQKNRLDRCSISLLNFSQKLSDIESKLSLLSLKLAHSLEKNCSIKKDMLMRVVKRINASKIMDRIDYSIEKTNNIEQKLHYLIKSFIEKITYKLISTNKLLESYSHKNVLARGFAMVTTQNGALIKTVSQIQDTPVFLELSDGKISMIKNSNKFSKKQNDSAESQGSLF